MKIKFIFAWYDFWVGIFYDKNKKWIYIFIIPIFGIVIKLKLKHMNRPEYLEQLKLLEDDFNQKSQDLLTRYALSNAKFNIGDIIKNYRDIEITIEEIKYFLPFEHSDPVIIYIGTSIDKFGKKSIATIDERDIVS